MKENKITVRIDAPVSFVYEFTINPNNTHVWISLVQKEETNEWPVRVGSMYRNTGDGQSWDEYILTDLIENKFFKLEKKNSSYIVEYHYKELSPTTSELTYFEYGEDLNNPFDKSILENLVIILEKKYKDSLVKILKDGGFPIVYEWTDAPHTVYEDHAHTGEVSFYVTKGSVTFSGGIEKTVVAGEYFNVPVGVKHNAVVGADGCEYIVGQEIEGDA